MRFPPRTLRGQLTLLFLILTIVPAVTLALLVTPRWLDALSSWQQPGVQEALDGSAKVAQDMIHRAENDMRQRGQILAQEPGIFERPEVGAIRERLATSYNLDFLQIYDASGKLTFEASRDPLVTPPGELPDVPNALSSTQPFVRVKETGVLAFLEPLGQPGAEDRILVVGNFMGRDFYPDLDNLFQGVSYYKQLPYLIRVNQRAVVLSAILVLLVLILISMLVARRLASRVSQPVEALGLGMHALSRGEEGVRVQPRGGEEMEQLIATFNSMSSELGESRELLARAERLSAWRDVARRVAHEMRNALTPIAFSLHRAQRKTQDLDEAVREQIREPMDNVLEEVEGLKRLAASFGELARLPVPELKVTDLVPLLHSCVGAIDEDRLTVHWEPSVEVAEVWGDKSLLRQALTNLIRNATEATEAKGELWVSLERNDEETHVVVEDNGPGWPEGVEGLLEPYVTTKDQGTGLGLSIVQRTAFQHGGRIELEDRPGGGARVRLILPNRLPVELGELDDEE